MNNKQHTPSELPKPLPHVPGPKLAPFTRTAHASIEFLHALGNPKQDMDGQVWEVRIRGKLYALKMFWFNGTEYLRFSLSGEVCRRLASPQLYVDYFDPFSCECRAYGRLKEENREDLAVRAHGYLLLTPDQEAEVTKRITGMPYDPDHTNVELNGDNPWDPFTPRQVADVCEDLEDLHKLGILVRDINVFNYLGGKLVDFGRAWTTPHPWSWAMDPYDVQDLRMVDPIDLQTAIIQWGTGNGWNWGEVIIPQELRDRGAGNGHAADDDDGYGADPRLYDWRKWEKDPAAADEFYENKLFVLLPDAAEG